MVYGHQPSGFGRRDPDDNIFLVGGHGVRDPVLGCPLSPRCRLPLEGDWHGSVAGQPRTQPWDTLAGWRLPFEGTLQQHLVIPGVEVSEVMVAQGLYRFVHCWGGDNLYDGAIRGWVYLHLGVGAAAAPLVTHQGPVPG